MVNQYGESFTGQMVLRLNGAGKLINSRAEGQFHAHEYNVTWNWDVEVTDLADLVDKLTERTLRIGQEAGYPRVGILLLLDTEIVEATHLEELQRVRLDMRARVDAHNLEKDTDYYIMVGLCCYTEEQKYRHSDIQTASANAIFCAFNSFLGKRATLDLNRYLLD